MSNTTPTRERSRRTSASGVSAARGSPKSVAYPESSFRRPSAARIIVVFPAPFAPTRPTISPDPMERLAFRSEKESLTWRFASRISRRFDMGVLYPFIWYIAFTCALIGGFIRGPREQRGRACRAARPVRPPAQPPVRPLARAVPQLDAGAFRVEARGSPRLRSCLSPARLR